MKKEEYYRHTFRIQGNEFELTFVVRNNKLSECYMYSAPYSTSYLIPPSTATPKKVFVFSNKRALQAVKSLIHELTNAVGYMEKAITI